VHVFVWKTKNERKWLRGELAQKESIDSIGTRAGRLISPSFVFLLLQYLPSLQSLPGRSEADLAGDADRGRWRRGAGVLVVRSSSSSRSLGVLPGGGEPDLVVRVRRGGVVAPLVGAKCGDGGHRLFFE
jgi:hypothetical protein